MQDPWDQRKERVRAGNPIQEVAVRYTHLVRAGQQLRGLCPLHEENTPSFVVYPEQGRWWCYGACQTGGDVFKLVMLKEGLDFKRAVEFLDKDGASNPSSLPQPAKPERGSNASATGQPPVQVTAEHYTYLTLAADLYHAALASEIAQLRYLDERHIDGEAVRRFRIGYADGESLRRYFQFRGWKWLPALAEELGLVRKDERGREYEYFRQRLIIPELDRGRTLYLVGRSTHPQQKVKYIGLNRVPKPLFGLAELNREGTRQRVFVCEGPFDWLTLKLWDLPAVCLLGSYLKKDLRSALEQFERVYVVTDFDTTGQTAARVIACELGARAAIVPRDPALRGKDANELAQNYRDASARFVRLVERADMRAHESARIQDMLHRLRTHLAIQPNRSDITEVLLFKLIDAIHLETTQGKTVVLWSRAYAEHAAGKANLIGRHVIRSVGELRAEFLQYSARRGGKADAQCNLSAAEYGEVIIE